MENRNWWGAFRLTNTGSITALGPYKTHREAERVSKDERQHWDCNVSPPCPAKSKEEAQEIAEHVWHSNRNTAFNDDGS